MVPGAEEGPMLKAYVLIQTDAGGGTKVRSEIGSVPGVRLAQSVTGPYDLVVRAEVEDMDALGQMLGDIQLIPGLTRTLTCIVKA
jgi:DNA-binding Lrp family transcriptional regulator